MSDAPEENPNAIRLKPKPIIITPDKGFGEYDLFGYKEFGEKLGRLFISAQDLDVAVLDDEWGSGKTIFAKQWAGHMRNKGQMVLEIDAFANDYQDDPFNLLVLEILAAFGSSIGEGFLDAATKLGSSILLNTAEVMTAGVVKGKNIEEALEKKYKGASEAKRETEGFKKQLASIAGDKKLIIVVDELDRCRPDFAIRFIERIKHFFDVPNVSFLLITSKTHLASMVGVLYGFDASTSDKYLSKFIDVSARLPRKTPQCPNKLWQHIHYLTKEGMSGASEGLLEAAGVRDMNHFAEAFNMSLRDIEKVYSIFCLTGLVDELDDSLSVSILALASLKVLSTDLYMRAEKGEAIWPELVERFNLEPNLHATLIPAPWQLGNIQLQLAALLSTSNDLFKAYETGKSDEHSEIASFAANCARGWLVNFQNERVSKTEYLEQVIDRIESVSDFSI